MSQETLSALLDGECSAEELDGLLDDIERSPALKARWSRLCLSREAMEDTVVRKGQPCICAGVMAGLDAQPAELANPKVQEFRRPAAFNWRPVAGLAAAASVATVALLVGMHGGAQAPLADGGLAAQPVAPLTQPVSYPVGTPARNLQAVALRPSGEQQWQDAGDDLDNYLIEHNSSVAGQGVSMGGTLRYARFAAHSATYHPDGQP